jgi:hypothetical protein
MQHRQCQLQGPANIGQRYRSGGPEGHDATAAQADPQLLKHVVQCVFAGLLLQPDLLLTLHMPAGPDDKHRPALDVRVVVCVHLACAQLRCYVLLRQTKQPAKAVMHASEEVCPAVMETFSCKITHQQRNQLLARAGDAATVWHHIRMVLRSGILL